MKNLINLTYKEKDGVIECNEFEFYLIMAAKCEGRPKYIIIEASYYYRLERIDIIASANTLEAAKEWLHNEVVEIVQRLFGVK